MAISLILMIIIMVAVAYGMSMLMRTRQKFPNNDVDPDSEITAPTADEGKSIAVLFGTRRIKGLNVVWYGDIKTDAIMR